MGGGTVTIPLLILIGNVPQKIAQSANLFAFAPMSLVALSAHEKNGLLEKRGSLPVVIAALLSSLGGSLLAAKLPSEILRKAFGLFLAVLSFFTFRSAFQSKEKS